MAAPKKNLPDIMRGDARNYKFTFVDKAGNPVDISNTTMWSTLKVAQNDPDSEAVLQKSVTFPADANSVAGIGWLPWLATDTETFEPGSKYWYDFQWVRAVEEIHTMAWGQIKILQDITETTV